MPHWLQVLLVVTFVASILQRVMTGYDADTLREKPSYRVEGNGGVLYTLRSGTPSYTHENRRGDVVAKTTSSGTLSFQAQYVGSGRQSATNGSTLDRQGANTKDTDPTGLIEEGMRYTAIEAGDLRIFLTRDPAGFVDGPNEYSYVVCNPWTSFDPEGLFSATDLIPDPRPSLNQGMEGWNEAFSSESTIGQRAFGVTEGLAFDLDATVNLIPGEGYAEHTAEKVVVNEVKKEIESGVKQEVKTTAENSAKSVADKGVKPYETGTFKDLKDKSKTGDGLDIDHQPSKAAQLEAAEQAKGEPLTAAEKKKVIDEGTAVAVPQKVHQAGPTYGGKNTKDQIQNDAKDLSGAAKRDSEAMVKNAPAADKPAAAAAAKKIQDANSGN